MRGGRMSAVVRRFLFGLLVIGMLGLPGAGSVRAVMPLPPRRSTGFRAQPGTAGCTRSRPERREVAEQSRDD